MIRRLTLPNRLRRRLAAEEGLALVLALGISVVLGATGATVVAYSSQNYGSASRSKAEQSALALAEAGLNYAYATLYAASNPTMPGAVPERTVALDGGTATYYGTLSGNVWTLTGIGRVRNPTGPVAGDVVRTVSASARLGSSTHGSGNNAVWNYVYADELTTCTTLGNSSVVNVPLYVRGNLCLNNSAQVTGYALQVGGTVSQSNQSSVGTAEAPISEAHIGAGCSVAGGPLSSPCGPADRVWAQIVDNRPIGLTKPPVDLEGWYRNAKPGPMHNCTSGSFPGGFDSDGTMNRSRGTVDLTPNVAYDCTVLDAGGNLLGRIAWTPGSPGTLTIAGTIFFDGDIHIGQYSTAVYRGRATIYASGTISLGQQSSLCGVAGCGTDWKPAENLLAFVAGSSTDATSFSVSNFSTFQGAIYAVNDYREGNNSTVWGPIIARQIYLQNSTLNHYVPIGVLLPGMPSTQEESLSITNEPGSWG